MWLGALIGGKSNRRTAPPTVRFVNTFQNVEGLAPDEALTANENPPGLSPQQPIPHPRLGHDKPRLSRIIRQLLAQVAHHDAQVVAVLGMGRPPRCL